MSSPANYTDFTTCLSQKCELRPGYQVLLDFNPSLPTDSLRGKAKFSLPSDQLSHPPNSYTYKDCLESHKSSLQPFPPPTCPFLQKALCSAASAKARRQQAVDCSRAELHQRLWRQRKDRRKTGKGAGQRYGTTAKLKHRRPF